MFAGKKYITEYRFKKKTSIIFFSYILYSDASMMSMRRRIVGKSPAEIKLIKREEVDLPVTTQDFDEAMNRTKKSNDVAKYESWMEEFGSC